MNWIRELGRRLLVLLRQRQFDADLKEEMRLHRELREQEQIGHGLSPRMAHYVVQKRFGNDLVLREVSRDMWGWNWLENSLQDVRYGLRRLVKSPGFTAVAVLTLALGIGANTALFQLLDAVRLRMLPVNNPQELAELRLTTPAWQAGPGSFYNWHAELTNAIWERIREQQQAFIAIFAWAPDTFNLAPRGEARLVPGIWVSGDFFNALGVKSAFGRLIAPTDDQHGCGSAGVVVSYSFWQSEFGGDPAAVGRKLTINYHPVEVIGVTPPSFFGLEVGRSFDVALPICSQPVLGGEDNYVDVRYAWWLTVMGRLKRGWSLEKATAYLGSISPGIFEATLPAGFDTDQAKKYRALKLAAYPAANGISALREDYSKPLSLLLGIVGLVLLIACANLANLLLARASAREHELAVRQALGAPRSKLIRQMLTESLILAAVGAGLAIMLAKKLAQFLASLISTQGHPVFVDLATDWRVFGFTGAVAVLTVLLFGLAPALRATHIAPTEAMKAGGRAVTSERKRFGLRPALVISQAALSLVLLVGALLFTRSLQNLLTVDLGFQRSKILIAAFDLTRFNLPAESQRALKQQLLERLRPTPGVDSAAETAVVPISGSSMYRFVWIGGSEPSRGKYSRMNWITSNFFKTLETPLVAGRDFNERDTPTSLKVAIVNEAFVHEFANGKNLIGKILWKKRELDEPQVSCEIVGVVKDTKYQDVRENFSPVFYVPSSQNPHPDPYEQIVVRTHAPLADLISRVKQAVADVNPDIVSNFQVMDTMIRERLLGERLMATLSSLFAALAVLLACTGLYGVMAYAVARRTNEIGIRMALGAERRQILRLVLREALVLVVAGVAIGLPVAFALVRLVSSQLFGLKPTDPITFGGAAVLLAVVALFAGYIPARQATKVDPMVALRHE
jgi:predicted permease